MNKLRYCLAASVVGVLVIASVAHAAPIDTLTLTTTGSDTVFAIAGTFSDETPTTPFSAPNTPYVLTFTVPTTPSEFAFVDSDNGVFGIGTVATL